MSQNARIFRPGEFLSLNSDSPVVGSISIVFVCCFGSVSRIPACVGTEVSGSLSIFINSCESLYIWIQESKEVATTVLIQSMIERNVRYSHFNDQFNSRYCTWWFIPLGKWVVTPVLSGLTPLIPFITRVVTH